MSDNLREFIRFATTIFLVGLSFLIIYLLIAGVFVNRGEGMSPTAKDNDIFVYNRIANDYVAGDVVVTDLGDSGLNVLRIVAVPGDEVSITHDGLMINGYLQTGEETLAYEDGIQYPVKLGDNQYFLLGDNRSVALDSRLVGAVSGDSIQGRAMLQLRFRGF